MNHYSARQRKDGRYDYTRANKRLGIFPVGYCAGFLEPEEFERVGIHLPDRDKELQEKFRDKYHKDGHETADEACECYRQYLIDHESRFLKHSDELRKCEICGEWTDTMVMVGQSRMYELCENHQDDESIEKVMPKIGEIWGST